MTWQKLALSLTFFALVAGAAGAGVWGQAARREAAANANFPATGTFVSVEGLKIHLQTMGSGPDIVLLHGANGNLRDFTFALMSRLAQRYRVTAFDRPGHGWSDPLPGNLSDPAAQAAILRKAAAGAGIEQPIVVGHSYGGAVALAWALEAPEETPALVLLAGASMPWEGGVWYFYNIAATAPGRALLVPLVTAFAPTSTPDSVLVSIFAPDPVPVGYAAHIGGALTLRRASIAANSTEISGLKPYIARMTSRYGALTMPVELLHGDADVTVPLKVHSAPLSGLLADANLTVLQGVGHMPHHADENAAIAAIDRAAARAGLR